MKHADHLTGLLPVTVRNLRIATSLALNPDFVANPRGFARRSGVQLAGDISSSTDFRQNPDRTYGDERVENTKLNIQLVRQGAILLSAHPVGDGYQIRRIELNPSMLLYEKERHWFRAGDLESSLTILRAEVAPLLADPDDAQHIVPGPVHDKEPVAFWTMVDSELLLPGTDIQCLHRLCHPFTGPAAGAKANRIQLGDRKDECWIRFKEAKWMIDGPGEPEPVEGCRVRLCLKGSRLVECFRPFVGFVGFATIHDIPRLVALSEPAVALVHEAVMARLEGTYLPVPPEWRMRETGKPLTHAKAMALIPHLASVPLDDIRALDEELRYPSKSTRKRLKKDIAIEARRLVPVRAASLFGLSAYAEQPVRPAPSGRVVDPVIAKVYGTTSPLKP